MDAQMGAPGFWDSNERAQKHIVKLNILKKSVLPVVAFQKKVDDVGVMIELVEVASPGEREHYAKELDATVAALGTELDAPLHLTWSCYQGGDRPCGLCDACVLRARGFDEAGMDDPALA